MKPRKQTKNDQAEMSPEQKSELFYLLDLLFESARWKVSEDDPYSAIECEVRDRIDRLQGILQGRPEPKDDIERSREQFRRASIGIPEMPMPTAPTEGRVKVQVAPGVYKRLPVFMLTQEPCRWSRTGYTWKVKPEYQAEVDAKPSEPEPDKLGDEFWSDHEKC